MKRRASGEGNVRQRADGRWEARVRLGDGRRKSLYGETQREVLEQLRALERGQDRGVPVPTERATVGQYLASWIESSRARVRVRTWEGYDALVRKHTPSIAKMPLAKLTPQHLDRLYADVIAGGRSPMTVRHLHALLHKAFDQAEKWGLVARNVAALVSPPRAPRQEMKTLTEEQARAFLEAASGERYEALYVVALSTGMRLGELLALRWRDLDLERATAHVQQSVQISRDHEVLFTPPKTTRSRRKVQLTNTAVAALRRQRTRQLQERLAAAGAWADLDLVFADEIGNVTLQSRVRWNFESVMRRAALPRIRFHDLRHTAATLLLGRGVHPKIVSEMLGHSTIAITLDLYSHVTPTMQREGAAMMDAVLGGTR